MSASLPEVRRPPAFAAALAAVLAVAPGAWAQPAPEPAAAQTVDPARAAFDQGVEAMSRQDWPAAYAAFERSMQLRRSAAPALNLGVTLHRMGRLLEARVRLQEFSELATPSQHQLHDAEVQSLLTEINRGIGRLRLEEVRPATAVVTVDGRRVSPDAAGEVPVDPGSRTVRAEAPGYVAAEQTIEVGRGSITPVRLSLAAAPEPEAPPPRIIERVITTPHPREEPSPPVTTRWWFWTSVGAGAVVAGVLTAVVISAASSTAPIYTGNQNRVLQAVEVTP
ncbi:MAG: PEGA domain-containing protein [Polyangiales bacterium]